LTNAAHRYYVYKIWGENRRLYSIRELSTFGDVAAEDDAVLDYFISTNAAKVVEANQAFLVLGRKGTGKTAIVRYLTEQKQSSPLSRPLNLRNYPCGVHSSRIDYGASAIEAYVSSWRYLIAVQVASLVISHNRANLSSTYHQLVQFLKDNYGGANPTLSDILRPNRLSLTKFSLNPSVMGNSLGGVDLTSHDKSHRLGLELNALTKAILSAVVTVCGEAKISSLSLHFDELDQGITDLDESRAKMLIGLVLAARQIRRECDDAGVSVNPVIYLRTDLWDELQFSDKNKITQSLTLHLSWDSDSLKTLIDTRLRAKLNENASWDEVTTSQLMRGSQPKWNHIISRTFLRPRDVIRFLNATLAEAKKSNNDPLLIENKHIVDSRDRYSSYLKSELDDEIRPHWEHWVEALQACSGIRTITFERDDFEKEYLARRSSKNTMDASEALELLYRFSVIGYERRSGYGGSSWAFQYTDTEAGWDSSSSRFKVHLGLKEFAKLREARL